MDVKLFNKRTNAFGLLIVLIGFVSSTNSYSSSGTIYMNDTYQTIQGFGASIAFYENWVVAHPNKEDIYSTVFDELGLDILRIRNNYRYESYFNSDFVEIVEKAYQYGENTIKVLMTSWTPPKELKSNNSLNDGGTLIKKNGQFDYEGFAQYWFDTLAAYEKHGIKPEYISIQNEPSFKASWESCILKEKESSTFAGYNEALKAVHAKLQTMDNPPKLLGPEVLGIGYNLFTKYMNNLDLNLLYGYAHHLYHGGDHEKPDTFINNMTTIADKFSDKPVFQTEFGGGDRGDWFQIAWIIHNALVHENVSAYLYWDLIWDNGGLVAVEFPWDRNRWTTDDGYIVTNKFHAFRHYSKFIHPGWLRVKTNVDDQGIKLSAFKNQANDSLTITILNTNVGTRDLELKFDNFSISNGAIVRTSETEQSVSVGSYAENRSITLSPRSITSILLEGNSTFVVENSPQTLYDYDLKPNYPNPFNANTSIKIDLPQDTYFAVSVFDTRGKKVHDIFNGSKNAGSHTFTWETKNIASGIYLIKLSSKKYTETIKCTLLK
ncbi:T9SS type A sorting domain-containing protein [bacterium]|nr:T9SS type A sorting domain-containing protein [bacterium]